MKFPKTKFDNVAKVYWFCMKEKLGTLKANCQSNLVNRHLAKEKNKLGNPSSK